MSLTAPQATLYPNLSADLAGINCGMPMSYALAVRVARQLALWLLVTLPVMQTCTTCLKCVTPLAQNVADLVQNIAEGISVIDLQFDSKASAAKAILKAVSCRFWQIPLLTSRKAPKSVELS